MKSSHHAEELRPVEHHSALDVFNWPVAFVSVSLWPWLDHLWHNMPGPTAIYMSVSAAFMIFQMSEKMGLLDKFKRRATEDAPSVPEE